MPWLAIKLFMGGLLKRLTGLLGVVGRYPWQSACIALLCLSGAFWHVIGKRNDTIAGLNGKIGQIVAASDENHAAQVAQVKALEAKSQQLARDNANVETQIRTVYVDRRDSYADRMRFDKVCRVSPGSPGQDSPAPIDNGPGADSVVVSRADFDIFVENTGRLVAVHQWGDGQLDAGLAVRASEVR